MAASSHNAGFEEGSCIAATLHHATPEGRLPPFQPPQFPCLNPSHTVRFTFNSLKSFSYRILEDSYVMKDPFTPDKEKFLILGSLCSLCRRSVCVGAVSNKQNKLLQSFLFVPVQDHTSKTKPLIFKTG